MKTQQVLQGNAIDWVRDELDEVLNQSRKDLELYIEEDQEPALLTRVRDSLLVISGTLQMLELDSAAMLAQEIKDLLLALIEGGARHDDQTYELLMQGILQLPNYLEHVQSGHRDVPVVLLPLLNDLRAARGATLLTEKAFFFPDLDQLPMPSSATGSKPTPGQDIRMLAKRTRHVFELGLLGWFQGKDVVGSLGKMQSVVNILHQASQQGSSQRLWWICSALIEALRIGAGGFLDSSVAVKSLMGKIDRQIKQLINSGEEVFASEIPNELIYDLLYYLAIAEAKGDRVIAVKKAFALSELLPDESEREVMRARISGPNAKLLSTVSQAIYEDLAEVKDTLEIFVSRDDKDPQRLSNLVRKLHQIADTLGMLGLNELREVVLDEAEIINGVVKGDEQALENAVMKMAGVMLNVELSIENLSSSPAESGAQSQQVQSAKEVSRAEAQTQIAYAEHRKLLGAISDQALGEMNKTKEAILGYIAVPKDLSHLSPVPDYLENIKGALEVAKVEQAPTLLESIKGYISAEILAKQRVPDNNELDLLADAITSVECFLEALGSQKKDPFPILEAGSASVEKLGFSVEGDRADLPNLQTDLDAKEALAGEQTKETSGHNQFDDSESPPVSQEPQPDLEESIVDDSADDDTSQDVSSKQETAQLNEPPLAEPKQQQQKYPIIASDVEEDILEIFLEEAEEEISNIKQNLFAWQSDPDNREALSTLHRSFHTIKGSGRLIGAQLIGEFAWSFEILMSQVIEENVLLGEEVVTLLNQAVEALPQLVDQIKEQSVPELDPYSIMEKAHMLGRNEQVSQHSECTKNQLNQDLQSEQQAESIGTRELATSALGEGQGSVAEGDNDGDGGRKSLPGDKSGDAMTVAEKPISGIAPSQDDPLSGS